MRSHTRLFPQDLSCDCHDWVISYSCSYWRNWGCHISRVVDGNKHDVFNALLTELSVGCHVQCVVDGTMMEPITETKSTKGTKESHHHSSYPSSVTAFTQGWDPGLACNMTVFLYPLSAIWRWSFHTNTSSACCSLAIEVNYSHLRLSAAERRLFSRCTAHGRRACFLVFFIHCRSMSFVTYLNVTQWADRK